LKEAEKPPQWKHTIVPAPVKYLKKSKRALRNDASLPNPEIIPEVNLHRDRTFLTAMNVENNEVLRTTAQKEMMKKHRVGESQDVETSSQIKGF